MRYFELVEGVINVPHENIEKLFNLSLSRVVGYYNYWITKSFGTSNNSGIRSGYPSLDAAREKLSEIVSRFNLNVDLENPTDSDLNGIDIKQFDHIDDYAYDLEISNDHHADYNGMYDHDNDVVIINIGNIFDMDFDDIFGDNSVKNIISGIPILKNTIHHELMHVCQYVRYAPKQAKQVSKNAKKFRSVMTSKHANYHNSNVEFYPLLTTCLAQFTRNLGGNEVMKRIRAEEPKEFSACIRTYLGVERETFNSLYFDGERYSVSLSDFFMDIKGKKGMFSFKKACREFLKMLDAQMKS